MMPGIQRGRIRYYITTDRERGAKECTERGWSALSYYDFGSAPQEITRLVWDFDRFDPAPYGGKALMIRGFGYEEHKSRSGFDAFVEEGRGEWVDA